MAGKVGLMSGCARYAAQTASRSRQGFIGITLQSPVMLVIVLLLLLVMMIMMMVMRMPRSGRRGTQRGICKTPVRVSRQSAF